jgi:activator of HSP90 ATPase
MATEAIRVSALVPASTKVIYEAWLSSKHHAAMTGGAAEIDATIGGAHTAWDGYITGRSLELEPGRRIVQSWRTSEFPEGSADSCIVVTLAEEDGHTRVAIEHTDIPEGQGARYESGWHEHYLTPMIAYFSKRARPRKATKRPAPAKKASSGAAKTTNAAKTPRKKAAPARTAKKPTRRKVGKAR